MRPIAVLLAALLGLPTVASARQDESVDYWRPQREMIRHGQQAILMCNGLFTSNRSLEQVFGQELAFLPRPVGTPTAVTTWSTGAGRPWPSARRAVPRPSCAPRSATASDA